MKIFKLTQSVNTGYDTYDSCIVIAEGKAEAKRIHPSSIWTKGGFYDEGKKEFWTEYSSTTETYLYEGEYGTWTNDLTKIEVEEIGEAKKGSKKGVVIASFNAG